MFGLVEINQEVRRQLVSNFRKAGTRCLAGHPGETDHRGAQNRPAAHCDLLAIHFMTHILKFEGGFWLSERPSSWDFPVQDTREELVRKIALRYCIDAADLIEAGILVDLGE